MADVYGLSESWMQKLGDLIAQQPGGRVAATGSGQGRSVALVLRGAAVVGPYGQTWYEGLTVWIAGGLLDNFSDGIANVYLVGVSPFGVGALLGEGEYYNAVCLGTAALGGAPAYDAKPVFAVGVPCDWSCTEIVTGDGVKFLNGHNCVTDEGICETHASSSSSGESSTSSDSSLVSSSSSSRFSTVVLDRLTAAEIYSAGCTTYLTTQNIPLIITKTTGGIIVSIEEGEPQYNTTGVYNCWEDCCVETSSSSSSGSGIPCNCNLVCSAYSHYTFTISGATNAGCANCTAWNGTHTLVYNPASGNPFCFGGSCLWGETTSTNFCFDGIGNRWYLAHMNFNGFNGWHLLSTQFCTANPAGGGFGDDYWIYGVFDPLGTNTFIHATSVFCNMPATLTLNPAGSIISPCPC